MRRFPLFLLSLTFALSLHTGLSLADLSVPPSDSHITYVGRFTHDYRFGWTGSAIRFKFDGSSAAALLAPTKTAAMQIVIDANPPKQSSSPKISPATSSPPTCPPAPTPSNFFNAPKVTSAK